MASRAASRSSSQTQGLPAASSPAGFSTAAASGTLGRHCGEKAGADRVEREHDEHGGRLDGAGERVVDHVRGR